MSESFDLDNWLNNGKKFEKRNYLKWKDRPGKKVNLFLHTNAPVVEIYRHSFYRVYDQTDKDTKVTSRKVQFTQLVCHEELGVSRRQNKRDADGNRLTPPAHCPLCMLGEWARAEVNAGRLKWTDSIFEFTGSSSEQNRIVRVGALYNAFGGDKLSDEQKADMRRHGLEPREAWKENHVAKGAVVFRAVDFDDLDKGVQIAIETPLVGDCIKKVIRDARESLGDMDGDPRRNPYCIQLEYKDKEPVFSKKYEARMIQKIKATPDVLNLIQNTEAPDLGNAIEPFNAEALRISLEKAALIKGIPFDRIFATAKQSKISASVPKDVSVPVMKAAPISAPPATSSSEELYECDTEGCTGLMKATDPKCNVCGRVYIEEPTPPPPPPARKRGTVAPAKVAPPVVTDDDESMSVGADLPF